MEELLDIQYVVYELEGEKYALRISDVYEIIKLQKITVVHNSKSFLEGVINLRGKIVPVISLHKRFGLQDYKITKASRIVVVKSKDEMVGMVVDSVQEVVKFTDIQPPPDMVAGIDGSFFKGIGISSSGVVSILKMEKVLYE